jgi:hypothetical protein
LSETVGSSGQVLAVDVNTRFLKRIVISNLKVQESEIATAAVQQESYLLGHISRHDPRGRQKGVVQLG